MSEQTANNEEEISEINLQDIKLDQIHRLFPMNPLCIRRYEWLSEEWFLAVTEVNVNILPAAE